MPRPHRAASAALVTAALLLSGCTAQTAPKTPREAVRDAVDNFSADNTGAYTLSVSLGPEPLVDTGSYRVEPDAATTLRTLPDGAVRRFVRLTSEVYLEAPPASGSQRTGCWLRGDAGDVRALRVAAGTDLVFGSAATEVPLSLRHGRAGDDGGLVADASLRAVVLALGGRLVKALGSVDADTDVEVTVSVEGARITGWRTPVADVLAAAGTEPAAVGLSGTGEIVATYDAPGSSVDLTTPDDSDTVPAEAAEACLAR